MLSDEKGGNGAAGLLQEFQEIGTAWRVVTGEEICHRPRQLVGEDESCGDARSFAFVGVGTRWCGGADREFNAQSGGLWRIGLELCHFAELQNGKNYEYVQQANRAEYCERRKRYVVHSVLLDLERERNLCVSSIVSDTEASNCKDIDDLRSGISGYG